MALWDRRDSDSGVFVSEESGRGSSLANGNVGILFFLHLCRMKQWSFLAGWRYVYIALQIGNRVFINDEKR